jgi:hypothetical protein
LGDLGTTTLGKKPEMNSTTGFEDDASALLTH